MTICGRIGTKLNSVIKLATIFTGVNVFVACGDDSGSGSDRGSDPEQTGEVVEPTDSDIIAATFDDLLVCSSKREGTTAYVKDERFTYVCNDGDWVPDDSDKISKPVEGSSSSNAKSSSGAKDNGDNSSSNEKFADLSSSSSMANSSSSFENKQDSTARDSLPVAAVKDKSISGASQKGPFVTGSAVKLYELDGKTCAQTGKSFTGKIASDDGKFSVSSVTLASKYALLEANGYFRNEVSGKKSSGTVTLNALTDLSKREKVNINLLTHLEYERALYLVGTGINVPSAKKQAEAEIFNAFGIQGEFANSEDLDIFSKGEGNAALLAFSVLMLRDLNEADLTELLTKFATDIEKDGKWDDEGTKARIADWAQMKDLSGGLTTIRSNIQNWNLGSVPDFEKFVRIFWYTSYGLGNCDEAKDGVVASMKNEKSSIYDTKMRFICKNGAWVEATDIEKDTYKWAAGEDGDLRVGDSTGAIYKYDESLNKWMTATRNDTSLKLMGCTTNRIGEIGKSAVDDSYYICKNMDWLIAEEIEYDTYGEKCTEVEEGKIIAGVVTNANKYYCSANGWVSLMGGWNWDVPKEARLNSEIEYGSTTDLRDNKVYRIIKIGNQTWMAENLNYADSVTTPSLKGKNWCYYNDEKNCDVVGRLYAWTAVIDSVKLAKDAENPLNCGQATICTLPSKIQGVCPEGWHLPNMDEFDSLIIAVGGESTAGFNLISQTGWYISGSDAFGFSALPSGAIQNGRYLDEAFLTEFWTYKNNSYYILALSSGRNDVVYYPISEYVGNPSLFDYNKPNGFSVRCVKD